MQPLEIGLVVRERRLALGLTPAQLALFATLSPREVAQIEEGAEGECSYVQLFQVLQVLGLRLRLDRPRDFPNALALAARSASTSYAKVLTAPALSAMLESGELCDEFQPHILTLLDEVPVPLVLCALRQVARDSSTPAASMLRHIGRWAVALQATQRGWYGEP